MVSATVAYYHVLEAIIPLYFAMCLAYACFKWWKIFTPDQCSGIHKFVSTISVPLLSFHVISANNPYKMSSKLILSDSLQKGLALVVLVVASKLIRRPILDTVITGFSLSTLSNTLIVGVPLLKAMYGEEEAAAPLSQIVVLQCVIWYNLTLFLLELRVARTVCETPLSEVKVQSDKIQAIEPKERNEAPKEALPRVDTKLILLKVGRKLMRNPNTHATIYGLIWSFISFKRGLQLPVIVENLISILANGGLGMTMFSLGLFMASQGSILVCGTWLAVLAIVSKFLMGPVLMAVASLAIGLRGTLLKIAIVQAALPQGIVSFVFAKEYNLHPNILSTGIALGMLVTLPVTMAYYSLLELLYSNNLQHINLYYCLRWLVENIEPSISWKTR